jgi:hypothetical protein
MHPFKITEKDFPNINCKIVHADTGHIYVRPMNNFKPFTDDEENTIKVICAKLNIGTIRNRVTALFETVPTRSGYGFRIFER